MNDRPAESHDKADVDLEALAGGVEVPESAESRLKAIRERIAAALPAISEAALYEAAARVAELLERGKHVELPEGRFDDATREAIEALFDGQGGAPLESSPKRKRAQKDELVRFVTEAGTVLWNDGDTGYATFFVHDHQENDRIRGRRFRRFMARLFHEQTGTAPNSQALQDARDVLEGRALFDGERHPVCLRVGGDGVERIVVDLGDESWKGVVITRDGWEVVPLSQVPERFIRSAGMRALPLPQLGGTLDLLRTLTNLEDNDSWVLYRAFLIGTFRPVPDGRPCSRPLLGLYGEQGSAKTSLSNLTRRFTDPAEPASRSTPRDERDLAINARNSWLLVIDNISSLAEWLSDALARIASKAGFATRVLYSDDEEMLFNAQRSVIVNGITEFVHRPDLLDRMLPLHLPAIPPGKRLREDVYWSRVEAAAPLIVGAIFQALASTMAAYPVEVPGLPRMADFAAWSVATEVSMGWGDGKVFLRAYNGNRDEVHEMALDGDPVADLIRNSGLTLPWTGTASDLLGILESEARAQKPKNWPKTPRAIAGALRRIVPDLRAVGFIVEFTRAGRSRSIQISKAATVTTVTDRHTVTEAASGTGDGVTQNDGRDGRSLPTSPDLFDDDSDAPDRIEADRSAGEPAKDELEIY